MEFKASHRYAPVTARKARPVMNMVRGMKATKAIEALRTTHRRAAMMLNKVIRSAMANAEQTEAIDPEQLYIKTCFVNEGPLKQGRMRWRAGAMGRIKPIHKRQSHIEVRLAVIDDGTSSRRRKPEPEAAADENQD